MSFQDYVQLGVYEDSCHGACFCEVQRLLLEARLPAGHCPGVEAVFRNTVNEEGVLWLFLPKSQPGWVALYINSTEKCDVL